MAKKEAPAEGAKKPKKEGAPAPGGGKPPRKEKGAPRGEARAEAAAPAEKKPRERRPPVVARLKTEYDEKVVPELMKKFQYRNKLQAPRLVKIVVNMGVGDAIANVKLMDAAVQDLALITGQRPSIRRAKKSIANFKLRAGLPIGCAVTLRGARMYEFYDRLVNVAVPRIRDFRGLPSKSFDGRGNYTMGIGEQIIFPEINYDKVEKIRGMDITFVTTARSDEEGRELLRLMRFPFRDK
jgi:large subunit ribosomal protein L5